MTDERCVPNIRKLDQIRLGLAWRGVAWREQMARYRFHGDDGLGPAHRSSRPNATFSGLITHGRQRSRLIRLDCDPMLLSAFWVHFDEGIDHADRADRCR